MMMTIEDESNANNADDVSVLLMSLSSRQTEVVIARYFILMIIIYCDKEDDIL